MANAAKATQQKWKGIESKAKALAKQANDAHERAEKLARDALKQAEKAQEAYSRRKLKGKPKLADLTPAQIATGLGACNGHHTQGLPEDDLEAAWNATSDENRRWVLLRVGLVSSRRLSWKRIAKAIAKRIDYAAALGQDGSDKDFDSAIRDRLAFDPSYYG